MASSPTSLGEQLEEHCDDLVEQWYERWRQIHDRPGIDEAALKRNLPDQLRLIGQQLREVARAETPEEMWHVTDRLHPEKRVGEHVPIEEVVLEYALAVDVVRDWIEERQIDVPFAEYSYFLRAMFELVAESVRRYATHQEDVIASGRALYLAGIMHQLRGPLSVVSMATDLLERRDDLRDAATIARLRRSIRRMQFLVGGVLRLERFRPDEVPVRPRDIQPARLIDEAMDGLEPDAARKRLRLESHVDRTLQMRVDPNLFIDAIGNLLHNAVKYTQQGFVIVEMDPYEEGDDEVVFRVRDSGPGLTEEQRRTLFEHAQRPTGSGAGIGLQIAAHAIRAMGGSISLESVEGEGSVFTIRLPREVEPRDEPDLPGDQPEEVRPAHH